MYDESLRSGLFRDTVLCFNPAEIAGGRVHPFLAGLYGSRFKKSIAVVRAQDGLFDIRPAAPGQGDAELKEILSALECMGYSGLLSVGTYDAFTLSQVRDVAVEMLLEI